MHAQVLMILDLIFPIIFSADLVVKMVVRALNLSHNQFRHGSIRRLDLLHLELCWVTEYFDPHTMLCSLARCVPPGYRPPWGKCIFSQLLAYLRRDNRTVVLVANNNGFLRGSSYTRRCVCTQRFMQSC